MNFFISKVFLNIFLMFFIAKSRFGILKKFFSQFSTISIKFLKWKMETRIASFFSQNSQRNFHKFFLLKFKVNSFTSVLIDFFSHIQKCLVNISKNFGGKRNSELLMKNFREIFSSVDLNENKKFISFEF